MQRRNGKLFWLKVRYENGFVDFLISLLFSALSLNATRVSFKVYDIFGVEVF